MHEQFQETPPWLTKSKQSSTILAVDSRSEHSLSLHNCPFMSSEDTNSLTCTVTLLELWLCLIQNAGPLHDATSHLAMGSAAGKNR